MAGCTHELGERETACADGACPLCLTRERDEALAAMSADTADVVLSKCIAEADNERLTRERDEWHEKYLEQCVASGAALAVVGKLESEVAYLRALLRECLPLAVWHETSGMEGSTVAPRAEHGWVPLSDRIKAALEDA